MHYKNTILYLCTLLKVLFIHIYEYCILSLTDLLNIVLQKLQKFMILKVKHIIGKN